MIFRPPLVVKVLSGAKTETRRVVHGDKPCAYRAGRIYAVQPGRGKHAVGHVLVESVEQVALGAMTPQQARAEGFETIAEFRSYWERLYGPGTAIVDLLVWRIRFRVAPKLEVVR